MHQAFERRRGYKACSLKAIYHYKVILKLFLTLFILGSICLTDLALGWFIWLLLLMLWPVICQVGVMNEHSILSLTDSDIINTGSRLVVQDKSLSKVVSTFELGPTCVQSCRSRVARQIFFQFRLGGPILSVHSRTLMHRCIWMKSSITIGLVIHLSIRHPRPQCSNASSGTRHILTLAAFANCGRQECVAGAGPSSRKSWHGCH